jgi:putative NADH-flavin reductase
MNIVVFGANGKVGSLVVAKAIDVSHKVVAFVYGAHNLTVHQNLRIVQGDIYDARSVEDAIMDSDVVISALGSWHTPQKNILTKGMQNIIPAMQKHSIKRIISLTGHDARWDKDTLSVIHRLSHLLLAVISPKILYDGEKHIELLDQSGLDWTVLRSPVMNQLGKQYYRLTTKRPMPWLTINRSCVAQALVDQCKSKTYIKSAPYLTRS